MKKFKGQSITADFETGLWTFKMEGNYEVSGREYVIIPVEEYKNTLEKLSCQKLGIEIILNSKNLEELTKYDLDEIRRHINGIKSIISKELILRNE